MKLVRLPRDIASGLHVWVNPRTVKCLWPTTSGGTEVEFSDGSSVRLVDAPPAEVADLLRGRTRTEPEAAPWVTLEVAAPGATGGWVRLVRDRISTKPDQSWQRKLDALAGSTVLRLTVTNPEA